MADRPGHLQLDRPAAPKGRRPAGRPRRWPYARVERDYNEFRRDAARMLRSLDDGCRADAARHARYGYTPYPIFRINLTQRVPYDRFRKSLESAGVETVSSATGRAGYWVVAGGEGHAGRIDRQIERRASLRGPTFVDAIASFAGADPRKKLGGSLELDPVEGGLELVDVEAWRLGDDALDAFEGQLRAMVEGNGGRITDTYRARDTFVMQIACDAALLSTVASLREVVRLDRPLRAEPRDRAGRNAGKIAAMAGVRTPDALRAAGQGSPMRAIPGPATGRPARRGADMRTAQAGGLT